MSQITIDFSKQDGPIKPMHGIGNAPILGTEDKLFHYLGEAGIPYSRLHDTGGVFGGGRFVDIPNIFRDFNADPDDPQSYDFSFTDWLISLLHAQGVEPFYRLGVTIENGYWIKPYRIFPPADMDKWAKICAGIIRHYNEGWADGFHYGITYWEIWNEPDNEPVSTQNPMWQGTKEEYFKLYEITSNYLKKQFPDIKVGGYASCGFYALTEAKFAEVAHSSQRTEYFIEFFHDFMKYISQDAHKSPLDFFSWHNYAGVSETVDYAEYARKTLDSYGFTHTESILNEWNPGIQYRGTSKDAAKIAEMFCAMQLAPVDNCIYYDGQVNSRYGGLFDPLREDVCKAYYTFKAFNTLYRLGKNVPLKIACDGLYGCAATDGRSCAVMLTNSADYPLPITLSFANFAQNKVKHITIYSVDGAHDLDSIGEIKCYNETFLHSMIMPENCVLLIQIA